MALTAHIVCLPIFYPQVEPIAPCYHLEEWLESCWFFLDHSHNLCVKLLTPEQESLIWFSLACVEVPEIAAARYLAQRAQALWARKCLHNQPFPVELDDPSTVLLEQFAHYLNEHACLTRAQRIQYLLQFPQWTVPWAHLIFWGGLPPGPLWMSFQKLLEAKGCLVEERFFSHMNEAPQTRLLIGEAEENSAIERWIEQRPNQRLAIVNGALPAGGRFDVEPPQPPFLRWMALLWDFCILGGGASLQWIEWLSSPLLVLDSASRRACHQLVAELKRQDPKFNLFFVPDFSHCAVLNVCMGKLLKTPAPLRASPAWWFDYLWTAWQAVADMLELKSPKLFEDLKDSLSSLCGLCEVMPSMNRDSLRWWIACHISQVASQEPVQHMGYAQLFHSTVDAIWVRQCRQDRWSAHWSGNETFGLDLKCDRMAGFKMLNSLDIPIVYSCAQYYEQAVEPWQALTWQAQAVLSGWQYWGLEVLAPRLEVLPLLETITSPPVEQSYPIQAVLEQAECPFRSFAHFRLHCGRPEQCDAWELSWLEKSRWFHLALDRLWQKWPHQEVLKAQENQWCDLIETALNQSAKEALHRWRLPHQAQALALEKQRLSQLIEALLRQELTRAAFNVQQTRQIHTVSYANRTWRVMLDRIDQVGQQILLIDYRFSQSAQQRSGDRQSAALYLAACGLPAVSGAVVEECYANAMTTAKKTASCTIAQQTPDEFTTQMEHWTQEWSPAVQSFLSADVRIRPKEGQQTCMRCKLQGLCRIPQIEAFEDE